MDRQGDHPWLAVEPDDGWIGERFQDIGAIERRQLERIRNSVQPIAGRPRHDPFARLALEHGIAEEIRRDAFEVRNGLAEVARAIGPLAEWGTDRLRMREWDAIAI